VEESFLDGCLNSALGGFTMRLLSMVGVADGDGVR
jgi:hypothetical protein